MAETLLAVYDALLLDHIRSARNYGLHADGAPPVEIGNPLCGDVLQLQLSWQAERLAEVRFSCECCGIAMGSASLMTELLPGHSATELAALAAEALARLGAPAPTPPVPSRSGLDAQEPTPWSLLDAIRQGLPARRTCASLGWQALQAALAGETHLTAREIR